jgi:photosystem II stability/assembly factor-like uncharacterized protein
MSDSRLILGTRKGLLILEGQAGRWKLVHEYMPGIPFSYGMVDHRSGVLWGGTEHGHFGLKLYRATEPGAELEQVDRPEYPDGAVKYDVWDDQAETPASMTYIWTITPGGDDMPNRLYIGSEPGGVFRSDDGGVTFELIESLWNHPSRKEAWFGGGRDQAGACSIVVDPRDSDHLFVGVSCGGVFESSDGGATWEGRNNGIVSEFLPDPKAAYGHDPHCLVGCPAEPDTLWQQNHVGVFVSRDGAYTWTDVSETDGPVKFGFPVVVDEQEPESAWVVPGVSDDRRMAVGGALCVSYTSDCGQSWTPLRDGLPQELCYDIVLRHALDKRGDLMAFGSTTGNLFVSEDRGQSWESVGCFLPPIYSVRIA